ncbi:MAG: 23S rRNA (pseudouridine(1915)-N(3))-methyltransferase RlmH, partial [Clostridiales bacterium]|nr:23S rRNA (pseudouridine(1915)-N(3))-methyltransferase RlmH [Clostridiales bacterium]
MDIRIIAVGRVKEPYIKQGINIYQKSLRAYASVEIVEVIDERAPDNLSLAQIQMVKAKEGQRIEKLIRPYSFVIALAIDGQTLSSPALAKK